MQAKKTKKEPLMDRLSSPKVIRRFWIILLTPIVMLALLLTIIAVGGFGKLPTFEELEIKEGDLKR